MANAMLKILNKSCCEYKSSAKVVDGNLILSLPNAVNPIVWRMELGSVKASALEVREGTNGQSLLILKTAKGEAHEIAPFTSRDQAVHALMRVSAALQSAEGQIASSSAPAAPHLEKERGSSKKWLIALGVVLLLIFLMAWVGSNSSSVQTGGADLATEQMPSGATDDSTSGVPQSADQMLRGF